MREQRGWRVGILTLKLAIKYCVKLQAVLEHWTVKLLRPVQICSLPLAKDTYISFNL